MRLGCCSFCFFMMVFCIAITSHAREFVIGDYTVEYKGMISSQYRQFFSSALSTEKEMYNGSIAVRPELFMESQDGGQSFSSVLFARVDKNDDDRTYFDVREMLYRKSLNEKIDISLGVGQIFWGVVEGVNVVDIVNQHDGIDGPLSGEKLGQPMVNLTYYGEKLGTLDLFVLPGLRERSYAGRKGRLTTMPGPDVHMDAAYESSAKQYHVDYAARLTKNFNGFDVSVSYFFGTAREPVYDLAINDRNEVVQVPYYDIINQTGLELQYAYKDTLLKFEGISRVGQGEQFFAFDTGFEHTMVGVMGSQVDVGLITEYLYEGRDSVFDNRGKIIFNPMTNDLMVGARINFNDSDSSDVLATMTFDLDSSSKQLTVQANRRINDSFVLSLEGVSFIDVPVADPAYTLRKDDYVQLELKYYF